MGSRLSGQIQRAHVVRACILKQNIAELYVRNFFKSINNILYIYIYNFTNFKIKLLR